MIPLIIQPDYTAFYGLSGGSFNARIRFNHHMVLRIMHSVGVDIIEINRIERVINRWGERFLNRVYTDSELKICRSKPGRLATRFAGKEAVMKALGTGIRGVGWREIEILAEPSGKPYVLLNGRARVRAEKLGLGELAVSLSDSREYAVAFVVGEV